MRECTNLLSIKPLNKSEWFVHFFSLRCCCNVLGSQNAHPPTETYISWTLFISRVIHNKPYCRCLSDLKWNHIEHWWICKEIHLCTLRRDRRKKVVLPSQLRTGRIYVNYNGQHLVLLIGENFSGELPFLFFLTPKQINKFLGNSNCWRLCGSQDANHFHIFWGCPNIKSFWKYIHTVLEKIVDISVLRYWEQKNKYMYRIILAKKLLFFFFTC